MSHVFAVHHEWNQYYGFILQLDLFIFFFDIDYKFTIIGQLWPINNVVTNHHSNQIWWPKQKVVLRVLNT